MNTSTTESPRRPVRAIYPLSLLAMALLAVCIGTLLCYRAYLSAQHANSRPAHVPYFEASGPLFERQIAFPDAGQVRRTLSYSSWLPAGELFQRYETFARESGCDPHVQIARPELQADCNAAGLGELRVIVLSRPGMREVEVSWEPRKSRRTRDAAHQVAAR